MRGPGPPHRGIQGFDVDLDDVTMALAPRFAVAGAHDEAVEPGVEAGRVAHGADVQPGRDDRVLGRIRCPIVVTQDQARGPLETIEGGVSEDAERFTIAVPGAKDEIFLHRSPDSQRLRGRIRNYEPPRRDFVPSSGSFFPPHPTREVRSWNSTMS